jgi:hypothetical protein
MTAKAAMAAHTCAEQGGKDTEKMMISTARCVLKNIRRAIERRALWLAEDAARELPNLPLEDLLQLVHLYAERGSPKYEKAALRWLERYIIEGSPRLQHFAEITLSLAKLESKDR